MSKQRKSWVWQYAERKDDKAYCDLCDEKENNEFSCRGGTTGSLIRHLKQVHSVDDSNCILSGGTRHISLNNDVQNEASGNLETSEFSLIERSNNTSSDISSMEPSVSKIPAVTTDVRRFKNRRRFNCNAPDNQSRECTPNQIENIHQSLAKMIAMNQLPLSFCSSEGFKQFMASVEPNYKVCSEQCIKKRLQSLSENVDMLVFLYQNRSILN